MKLANLFVSIIVSFIFLDSYAHIQIVELNEDDWQLFRNFRLESVRESPLAFGSTYEEELQETEASWKRRLNFNMLFAKNDDKIIGMIGAIIDNKEKLKHTAIIISFYVIPEFRNRGIGSSLLSSIINKLNTLDYIKKYILKVTTNQVAAIRLYNQFGFSIEGISKEEYLINNTFYDQLIMCKFNDNYINTISRPNNSTT